MWHGHFNIHACIAACMSAHSSNYFGGHKTQATLSMDRTFKILCSLLPQNARLSCDRRRAARSREKITLVITTAELCMIM